MNSIFGEQETRSGASDEKRDSGFSSLNLSDEADSTQAENWTGHDFEPPTEPMTLAETIRGSGMAYAAALTLFASVVFMLLLGWFLDLLLGSSPYGVVGGIIIGAVIGFVQFFRITSQIFKK